MRTYRAKAGELNHAYAYTVAAVFPANSAPPSMLSQWVPSVLTFTVYFVVYCSWPSPRPWVTTPMGTTSGALEVERSIWSHSPADRGVQAGLDVVLGGAGGLVLDTFPQGRGCGGAWHPGFAVAR